MPSNSSVQGTGIATECNDLVLRAAVVEPFVVAAFVVLDQVAGIKCERGSLSMRRGTTFTTQELTVVVGVVGEIHGVSLYGMSVVTALKIAGSMMGQGIMELDEMALSAIKELGNMISGHATTLLAETSVKCEITPPTLLRGVGIEATTPAPTLLVPVNTDVGRMNIDISLCMPGQA